MAELRSRTGFFTHGGGCSHVARYYYGEGEEAPPDRDRIDPENHTTWVESDGCVGIRRGKATSIGATPAYSANYDDLDWGN